MYNFMFQYHPSMEDHYIVINQDDITKYLKDPWINPLNIFF